MTSRENDQFKLWEKNSATVQFKSGSHLKAMGLAGG